VLDLGANGFRLATSLGMRFRLGRLGLGILKLRQRKTDRAENSHKFSAEKDAAVPIADKPDF
jgi:hypothetical protein